MSTVTVCSLCKQEPRSGRSRFCKLCLAAARRSLRRSKVSMSDTTLSDILAVGQSDTSDTLSDTKSDMSDNQSDTVYDTPRAVGQKRIEELEDEVARLKRLLAARGHAIAPPRTVDAGVLKDGVLQGACGHGPHCTVLTCSGRRAR
jgi:hypothetical protein